MLSQHCAATSHTCQEMWNVERKIRASRFSWSFTTSKLVQRPIARYNVLSNYNHPKWWFILWLMALRSLTPSHLHLRCLTAMQGVQWSDSPRNRELPADWRTNPFLEKGICAIFYIFSHILTLGNNIVTLPEYVFFFFLKKRVQTPPVKKNI